jgi:hypothetical protein
LEDIASALEGCSMAIVVASQVGSSVGLESLEDLNQPNILADNFVFLEKEGSGRRRYAGRGER